MAYIESELRSMRIVWSTVGDRVIVIGLIVTAIVFASALAHYLSMPASDLPLTR